MKRKRGLRLPALLVILAASGTASGQMQGGDHASHHPGKPPADAASRPAPMQGGGPGGMGRPAEKGRGKGGPGGKGRAVPSEKTELVPLFMNLGEVTPERLEEIRSLAGTRAAAGISRMRSALDRMLSAFAADDLAEVENGASELEDGLSQFMSGIAAVRALAERRSPRNTALRWLRSELHLVPPPEPGQGGGFLSGLSATHVFFMALVALVAIAGTVMYWRRTRRASELLERIAAAGGAAPDESASTRKPPSPSPEEEFSSGLIPVKRRKVCKMRVARIQRETPDVKTFRLTACDGGCIGFGYLPGQFLTITLPVAEGKTIRRSYTISSSPTQAFYCEITVKREEKGLGSRFLHDEVEVGDTFRVQAPNGKFHFTGKEADSIVLIAGGVGITPMMSITRALTDMCWKGDIHFLAAVRDPDHFIFREELERLARSYPNLHLHVAASRIDKDLEGFTKGRLSKERLAEWVPGIRSERIHLCGAPAMMDAVLGMLEELGVPKANIHLESFGAGTKKKPSGGEISEGEVPDGKTPSKGARILFKDSGKTAVLREGETILEAAERVGVEIESSCRAGMCGICAVKLLEGRVEMETEDGLDPEDKEKGMVLTCVTRCSEDIVLEA